MSESSAEQELPEVRMANKVDIVHKETGMTSSVIASTLPAWETAGWTRAENGSEESVQATPPSDPSSPPQTPPANPGDKAKE